MTTPKGTQENPYVIFSYGGGMQSNAVLALAAQGKLHFDAFIFANVGADSENPATLRYIEKYAKPFAKEFNIPLVELQPSYKGQPDTLLSAIQRRQGSVVIPALVEGSGVSKRTCTVDFKIRIINRYIRSQMPGAYVRMGIGFSTDEWTRARDTSWHDKWSETAKKPEFYGFWRQNYYPLLELDISRNRCYRIIAEAGLPVAPKSSCFFCPYHRPGEWVTMKKEQPELFETACQIDELLAERHQRLQGKPAFIHPSRKPLRDAVPDQMLMFEAEQELDACEIGHCMT